MAATWADSTTTWADSGWSWMGAAIVIPDVNATSTATVTLAGFATSTVTVAAAATSTPGVSDG